MEDECPHADIQVTREMDKVCTNCGLVVGNERIQVDDQAIYSLGRIPQLINNYQTKYQYNQVVRRLTADQRPLPLSVVRTVGKVIKTMGWKVRKSSIYKACKMLGKTHFQKKWVEIRFALIRAQPLRMPGPLCRRLDNDIQRCQAAFRGVDLERKIFPVIQLVIRGLLIRYGIITPFESYYNSYFPPAKCKITQIKYNRILERLFDVARIRRKKVVGLEGEGDVPQEVGEPASWQEMPLFFGDTQSGV